MEISDRTHINQSEMCLWCRETIAWILLTNIEKKELKLMRNILYFRKGTGEMIDTCIYSYIKKPSRNQTTKT